MSMQALDMHLEPPAPVWGVGRVRVGGQAVPWPVSHEDMHDETAVAAAQLAACGFAAGDTVLLVSMLSHAINVGPLEYAAARLGGLYSAAEATPYDAYRAAALCRQLAPRVVVGVCAETIQGLQESGFDPAAVFGAVPVVATADDEAHAALVALGMAPRRWLRLGPTTALECAARRGAHYDADRWAVEPDGPRLVLTNRAPRLTPSRRLPLDVVGGIETAPCECGSAQPRIVPR
ncbi:MAG: hypothetical protein AB7Q97_17605 [Gammaproteobacteria bacterium]